ncbi:cytochrome P450 [Mycena filopes]|nr:cytochrome P450 [Mycena filopes]
MATVGNALLSPLAVASFLPLLVIYVVFRRRSTVDKIPGPPSPSWIFGHTLQLTMAKEYGDHEFEWQKSYGPVYRIKGCFGENRLMVSDPVALQYILNSHSFKVAPRLENMFHLLYGPKSLVCANAEEHKSLRAAMNVGFTAAAVRSYQPIFEKAALKLSEELENSGTGVLNICPLLGSATLSTISEAVLGQSLEELGDEFVLNNLDINSLAATRSRGQVIADAIIGYLPSWLAHAAIHLPTPTFKIIRKSKRLAHELGTRVVREKVAAVKNGVDVDGDVYGVLLNLDRAGESKNGVPGDIVAAQTALIMVAGQDTTASTLALGLRDLAKMPEFQENFRAEIAANRGSPAYDSMPLLNAFIKEMLRVYPTMPLDDRIAVEDATIPLGHTITTSTGEKISEIVVEKGQILNMAIASFQTLESRWGDDASQFNPNRWLNGSAYKGGGGEALGPYANLLSFLGGPHSCLGWRFAVLEMQVFVCELVGKFLFALPENDPVRAQFVNTLIPWMPDERKGALLVVTPVV